MSKKLNSFDSDILEKIWISHRKNENIAMKRCQENMLVWREKEKRHGEKKCKKMYRDVYVLCCNLHVELWKKEKKEKKFVLTCRQWCWWSHIIRTDRDDDLTSPTDNETASAVYTSRGTVEDSISCCSCGDWWCGVWWCWRWWNCPIHIKVLIF